MKKVLIGILFAVIIILLFCSCTAAPPSDCRDELITHKWVIYDSFEKEKCTLSFADGRMMISAETGDNSVFEFNEEYIADTEKITVISENYGVLNIGYKIKNDKLVLTYIDKEIIFIKRK